MKKINILVLVLVLCLLLASCGNAPRYEASNAIKSLFEEFMKPSGSVINSLIEVNCRNGETPGGCTEDTTYTYHQIFVKASVLRAAKSKYKFSTDAIDVNYPGCLYTQFKVNGDKVSALQDDLSPEELKQYMRDDFIINWVSKQTGWTDQDKGKIIGHVHLLSYIPIINCTDGIILPDEIYDLNEITKISELPDYPEHTIELILDRI